MPLTELPERLSCFQVGLLPKAYLELLQALGQHIPTHLLVLSPSREYLEICRERRGQIEGVVRSLPRPEHTEQQPLFSLLCRQARQLDEVLANLVGAKLGREHFVESDPRFALEVIQYDICALRHRRPASDVQPCELSKADRSIEVHACHSKRREIEVLREVLLDAFDNDTSLAPEDVLVMLPDIQAYAPLLDAVFGAQQRDTEQIPYTIADRIIAVVQQPCGFIAPTTGVAFPANYHRPLA